MKWYEAILIAGAVVGLYSILTSKRNDEKVDWNAAKPGAPDAEDGGAAEPDAPDTADGGAGTGTPAEGRAETEAKANYLLDRQMYSEYLELLEGQPRDVFANTVLVEKLLLEMLKRIRLLHRADREFDAKIAPHEQRVLDLMETALQKKSLSVPIDRSLSKYHSLMDYVSRVYLGQESMFDDPKFWAWLDDAYPNVSKFLHTDDSRIKKTNSFVQILSIQFKSRDAQHVKAYMSAIDGLCRQTMEICADRACDYARKADDNYFAAKMEMVVLVAINRNFGSVHTDPKIPGSDRLADMSFKHDGAEHYVEVYAHASHTMAVPEIKEDIVPEKEWAMRFGKAQIKSLREAGVRAVYVMKLDDFQAMQGETKSRAFSEAACKAMPENSDIVVIIHGVEVASLRGGQIVEPSDLAVRLGKAIWDSMPETVAGIAP